MQNNCINNPKISHKLATQGAKKEELEKLYEGDFEEFLTLLSACGLEISKKNDRYFYSCMFTPVTEAEFCIVDIETNGSKIDKHQIIEIAAVKIKNNQITGKFESFVYCEKINEHITQITGIEVDDTINAPKLQKVLEEFRIFLGSAVFVAHDVKFDYGFISDSMQKVGLLPLCNHSMCSIDLAERTLSSYRYGLKYLNEYFNLHPDATHHRAMSDVITTYELFKKSFEQMEAIPKSCMELLSFCKHAKRLKRPQFDPLAVND